MALRENNRPAPATCKSAREKQGEGETSDRRRFFDVALLSKLSIMVTSWKTMRETGHGNPASERLTFL